MRKTVIRMTIVICSLLLINTSCSSKKSFYGEWQVTKLLDWPSVQSDETDMNNDIGKKISFSKEDALSENEKLENPIYQATQINKDEYETGYLMDFNKLGLKGSKVTKVEIYDAERLWESLGNVFFIIDDDTLVLWDYNCYVMKRIGK